MGREMGKDDDESLRMWIIKI